VTIIIMVAAIFLSLILLALVVVLFLFTQCRRRLGNIPPGNKELLHLTLKKDIYFLKSRYFHHRHIDHNLLP
jgi:hypothetical protein